MKASVEMSSSSASHVANKSLVAFDSLEAVEYHGFSAFFFFLQRTYLSGQLCKAALRVFSAQKIR